MRADLLLDDRDRALLESRRYAQTLLEERGVPVRELCLLEDRSQLQHPMPLRGDLREQAFGLPTVENRLTNGLSILARPPEEIRL